MRQLAAIDKVLRVYEKSGDCLYVRNNAKSEQGSFLDVGKIGKSDFLLFMPQGKALFLEVLTSKARQTDRQRSYQVKAERLGYRYLVVRDVAEVVRLFNGRRP